MFVAGPSLLQSEVALCQEEWGTYAARAAELFRLKDGAWLNRAAHLGWPSKIGADYEGFLREFVASQGEQVEFPCRESLKAAMPSLGRFFLNLRYEK